MILSICVDVLGRLRDLQYIFAVTSGSPSRLILSEAYFPASERKTPDSLSMQNPRD